MDRASGAERFDTVVIGAGPADLSVGYHLARRGQGFVIVDANQRIGDAWRQRWDSLRLFTPARYRLPGWPFPASAWSYPHQGRAGRLPGSLRGQVRPPPSGPASA
jgi:putative flavoprotein involved in K+ transport